MESGHTWYMLRASCRRESLVVGLLEILVRNTRISRISRIPGNPANPGQEYQDFQDSWSGGSEGSPGAEDWKVVLHARLSEDVGGYSSGFDILCPFFLYCFCMLSSLSLKISRGWLRDVF